MSGADIEGVLAGHRLVGFTVCRCGEIVGDPMSGDEPAWEAGHRAHVAAVLREQIGAARAEAWSEGWHARDVVFPHHHNPYRIEHALDREPELAATRASRPDSRGRSRPLARWLTRYAQSQPDRTVRGCRPDPGPLG